MKAKGSLGKFGRITAAIFFAAAICLSGCRNSGKTATASTAHHPGIGLATILKSDHSKGKLAVWFFNVKNPQESSTVDAGDTMLLRSPDGKTMMIDTGYANTIPGILDDIKKIGITRIDCLLLTHMHTDHVGGAPTVLSTLPVGQVVTSRFLYRNVGMAPTVVNALDIAHIQPTIVKEGDSFSFGQDISVQVLSPIDGTYEIPNDSFSNQDTVNENSVVIQMTYGKTKFLFTGDIQRDTESRLVETYGEKLKSDLIKVPHHGYNTSSMNMFVKAVNPQYAVVPQSLAPSLDVIQRYQNNGTKVFVTGWDGVVLAQSDGKKVTIETEDTRTGKMQP